MFMVVITNLCILRSPLKIWMPQIFKIANFGHPVSKSWTRSYLQQPLSFWWYLSVKVYVGKYVLKKCKSELYSHLFLHYFANSCFIPRLLSINVPKRTRKSFGMNVLKQCYWHSLNVIVVLRYWPLNAECTLRNEPKIEKNGATSFSLTLAIALLWLERVSKEFVDYFPLFD